MYENLSNFLTLSLTIFCFLPMFLTAIGLAITFYNFYFNYKTREIIKNVDENVNQILRNERDEYYKSRQ